MAIRVDVFGLLIAIAIALAAGFAAAGIGYLLGAPATVLGAVTGAIVSFGVEAVYLKRQKQKAANAEREAVNGERPTSGA